MQHRIYREILQDGATTVLVTRCNDWEAGLEGPVTTTDEATWIARARSGDAAAFEALHSRYERQIYAYIYRMMNGNTDDAQ